MLRNLIHAALCAAALLLSSPPCGAAGVAGITELRIPAGVFADGLAVSADDAVYVSGVAGETGVYRALPGEAALTRYIAPPEGNEVSYNGLVLDAAQRHLYVCANRNDFLPGGSPDRIPQVRVYDRDSGALVRVYPFPDLGACDDLRFDAAGNLYITDSRGKDGAGRPLGVARILVLRAGAAAITEWVRSSALYGSIAAGFGNIQANGIEVIGDQLIVNSTGTFKTYRIRILRDGSPGPVSEIQTTRPLDTPDGMCLAGGRLLVAEVGIAYSGKGLRGKLVEATLAGPAGYPSTARIRILHTGDSISSCAASPRYYYFLESQFGKVYFPDRLAEGLTPSVIHRRPLD